MPQSPCHSLIQVSCLVKPWLLASIEIGFSLTAELLQSPLNPLEGLNLQDFFCHLYLQEKKKKSLHRVGQGCRAMTEESTWEFIFQAALSLSHV